MGKSDTFKKGSEKGEVVVIKSRNLWANHSNSQTNHHRDTRRKLPDYLDFLVRITHIMLKLRFRLTTPIKFGILAMLIRIEIA